MDFSFGADADGPPAGVEVYFRDNALRIVARTSLAGRIFLAVLWVAASILILLAVVSPRTVGVLGDLPLTGPQFGAVWSVLTLVLYHFYAHKTTITLDRQSVTTVNEPWHVPFAVKVPMADVLYAETDTIIHTHRDRYGNEHETFTFHVQLTRESTPDHPILYRTGDEARAAYLRRVVQRYVEDCKAARAA
jgi:hypothetical protein